MTTMHVVHSDGEYFFVEYIEGNRRWAGWFRRYSLVGQSLRNREEAFL